jgi:ketosteroid isomerase-like protein
MRRILLAVMLCGFAISALAQADAVKEALLKADHDFNKATQERRAEGWMEYMDDNGVLGHPKPVVGRDAIRAALKEDWDDPNYNLTWSPDEAYPMPGNRMGYTRGHWTLTTKDKEGKPLRLTGQYLTVWRQNKQGEWKIIWDGGAADPPKK